MRTERFKGALLSTLVIASLITPLLLLSPSPAHADPVVTSIKVEPSSATLTVGDSKYFYAIATYSDGENEYVTSVAQWTVNPPSAGSMYIVCWYSIEPPFCAASFHAENAGKATVTASYMGYSDNAEVTILAPHDPIYIVGNDNFTPSNGVVGGSGTENDPYTIEYWDISAENDNGIEIRNTTKYFVIRNCVVENGWEAYHNGIHLYNVVNGRIENNTCENNIIAGIYLRYSDSNILNNNTCRNNPYGILLWGSNNNTLTNNTCENFIHPPFQYWYDSSGIYLLYSSNNNTLDNNTCRNINGVYGIHINYSSNNTIENNTCENSGRGIGLYYGDNNHIYHNTCEKNGWGISLQDSNNNTLSNNTCENNYYGIRIYESSDSSDNNTLFHNYLLNNKDNNAHDNCTNYWDGGYSSGGNYWSDYTGVDENHGENQDIPGSDGIGDTPYYIPGDNNRDRYPLVWTGTVTFSLKNLYTVNVEKILDIYQSSKSKLVVKFYTYANAFENENVIETFAYFNVPPNWYPTWHVEENEEARHPEGTGVKKARLDLTTNDTGNVLETIASFTVRKVDLEARFLEIPFYWSMAPPGSQERLDLETEFLEIPFYWSGAPD